MKAAIGTVGIIACLLSLVGSATAGVSNLAPPPKIQCVGTVASDHEIRFQGLSQIAQAGYVDDPENGDFGYFVNLHTFDVGGKRMYALEGETENARCLVTQIDADEEACASWHALHDTFGVQVDALSYVFSDC